MWPFRCVEQVCGPSLSVEQVCGPSLSVEQVYGPSGVWFLKMWSRCVGSHCCAFTGLITVSI